MTVKIMGHKFDNIYELADYLNMNWLTIEGRLKNLTHAQGYVHILKMDIDVLISIEDLKGINYEYLGSDGKARYSVPWTDRLQTTREVIEHCRPDLIELYDKSNPDGKWHPLILAEELGIISDLKKRKRL